MRNYELMTVFRPDLEEQPLQQAVERLTGQVTAQGGEISSSDLWGRRRLAYPIQEFRDGIFNVAKIKLDPKSADDLERNLKLNDQILRFLLLRTD